VADPGIGTRGESIDLLTALDLLGKAEALVAELEAVSESRRITIQDLQGVALNGPPSDSWGRLQRIDALCTTALAAVRQEEKGPHLGPAAQAQMNWLFGGRQEKP
jgi:hypothetical protein